MSLFIAAYDIARDSSRRQVANILLKYGRRVQESVFEIDLEGSDLVEMKRQIGPWLAATGLFDIFPVDLRRPAGRVRWQSAPYAEPVQLL